MNIHQTSNVISSNDQAHMSKQDQDLRCGGTKDLIPQSIMDGWGVLDVESTFLTFDIDFVPNCSNQKFYQSPHKDGHLPA